MATSGGSAPKRRRAAEDDPQVHPETRAQWRDWLEAEHGGGSGVWVVTWRKSSGKPAPTYAELVEEALCFGWVDSIGRTLDDDRTMLRMSPRKPGSGWARTNKERVARLTAAGLMADAGLESIRRAKEDGSWSKLDDVENLVVFDDLAAALADRPPARANWDAFPPSVRRGILEWIVQAKRAPTRENRVRETAQMAQRNERANQWRPS
jgi:uncharacterized protein YdeI (YjbR/CyaY-like superfamily)